MISFYFHFFIQFNDLELELQFTVITYKDFNPHPKQQSSRF